MAEPDNRPPWAIFGVDRDRSIFPEVNDPSGNNRRPWEMYGENAPRLHNELPESERPMGVTEFRRRHPRYRDRVGGMITNFGRGAPIVGHRIEDTQAARDFARTYPLTSGIGRFMVGAGLYAGPSRAVQGLSTVIGNLFRTAGSQRSTPGLISHTLGQGGLGAGVNVADTAVGRRVQGQDSDLNDLLWPGILGAAGGMAGPLGSRLLTPSGVGNRVRYDRRINPPIIHDLQDAPLIRGLSNDPGFRRAVIDDLRDAAARGRLGPGHRPPRLDRGMRFVNAERGRQLAARTGSTLGNVIAPIAGATIGGIGSGGTLMGALYGAMGGTSLNILARMAANSPTGQRYLGRTMPTEWEALINSLGPTATNQIPLQERQ